MHEKAHGEQLFEKRGDTLIVRGLPVSSANLGIVGVCDVVEFVKDNRGIPLYGRRGSYRLIPVEYKRGTPKTNHVDMLQLCSQSICLEERFCCEIEKGYLFYGETKHRTEVLFNENLRREVKQTIQEMHEMYKRRSTPKVKPGKFCRACSLLELLSAETMQTSIGSGISLETYRGGHMRKLLNSLYVINPDSYLAFRRRNGADSQG